MKLEILNYTAYELKEVYIFKFRNFEIVHLFGAKFR